MRRDMDLSRELLLKLEAMPVDPGSWVSFDLSEVAVEGYTDEKVEDHLLKLYRAGFIDPGASDIGDRSGTNYYFRGLSWQAQDFLDSVREPKVWTETKSRAEKVGTWTVGFLAELAKGYAKSKAAALGFPLG